MSIEELHADVRKAWADYHDELDALGTWHDAQWVARERARRGAVESAVANLTRAEVERETQDRVMRAESWAGRYESALKEIIALPQLRAPYTLMTVNEFGASVRRVARAALSATEEAARGQD